MHGSFPHLPTKLVKAQRPAHEAADSALVVGVRVEEERPPEALPVPPRARRQDPSKYRRLWQCPPQPHQQLFHLWATNAPRLSDFMAKRC